MQYREENNYPKALLFSGGAMILFLVISYLITFGTNMPMEEVGTGGIVVNYGTSETGMGEDLMSVEEPSVAPDANNTAPDKIVTSEPTESTPTTEATDKTVVTQDIEDAPVIATSKKKTTSTPTATTPAKETKPSVNPNALYKGKRNDGNGGGDGNDGTPGNKGDVDGDPMASNYGKGGSGFGNTQLSLVGRKFVSVPRISDDGQSSGKVAVEIRVDKTGTVVYARAGVRGTTLSDKDLWTKCEQAVRGASLNRLESAPDVQIGTVIFNFKVD
ncbi:energy transducer TonB [Desertivirga brevis]|uniref:energy transducer TonB n=1 Tax=Desertivirga brevis TaxID=2810310 RepID=UPI001A97A223|nr:energy transducer TonB [Pedobacter sp. SYSU D00873]